MNHKIEAKELAYECTVCKKASGTQEALTDECPGMPPSLNKDEEWYIKEFDKEFPSPDGHDFIGTERISSLHNFLHKLAHKIKEDTKREVEQAIAKKYGYFEDVHGTGKRLDFFLLPHFQHQSEETK